MFRESCNDRRRRIGDHTAADRLRDRENTARIVRMPQGSAITPQRLAITPQKSVMVPQGLLISPRR